MRKDILSTTIALALVGCATTHVPPNASSIDDLAKTYWRVQNYEFGKDQIIQTTIPHDRLSTMNNRLIDLSTLCGRQGGTWKYVGPPSKTGRKATPNPISVNSAISPSFDGAATKENMATTVRATEAAVAGDVMASTLKAMQAMPDAETREAVSRAEQLRWLGQFQCAHETKPWTAELRFDRPILMSSEGIVYKRDVVIDTILKPKQ